MFNDYLDVNKAFQFVLYIAKKKKISKRQLCNGIYDYSSFIKMCNGTKNVSLETVLLCAEKLNIPFSVVLKYGESNEVLMYYEYNGQLNNIIQNHRFEELDHLINELDQLTYPPIQQLLKKANAIKSIAVDCDIDQALELLYELLDGKISQEGNLIENICLFSEFDMSNLLLWLHIMTMKGNFANIESILHIILNSYYFDSNRLKIITYLIMVDGYISLHQVTNAKSYLELAEGLSGKITDSEIKKYIYCFKVIIEISFQNSENNDLNARKRLFELLMRKE